MNGTFLESFWISEIVELKYDKGPVYLFTFMQFSNHAVAVNQANFQQSQ